MDHQAKCDVVNKYQQAFAAADIEIIRGIFADNAVVEDPYGTEPKVGISAVLEFYEGALSSGVKLEMTGTPRTAGDSVAFPFQVAMGDMRIEVIDVFQFNEAGKVISMKAYWGPENAL